MFRASRGHSGPACACRALKLCDADHADRQADRLDGLAVRVRAVVAASSRRQRRHRRDGDRELLLSYARGVAVPASLLKQLLALGERERVELAHPLLDSVNDNDEMSDADRARLHSAIEQSISEIEAGQTIPLDEALASLRRKRAPRASG